MLDNVRNSLNKVRPGDKKCVAEMLLEDNKEGLTECKPTEHQLLVLLSADNRS